MSLTFASLFSGGGGADIGAMQAGLKPIWGVELDSAIAEVYAANIGHQPINRSVADVSPLTLERPDVLWMSPPCQAHSVARSKSLAPREDADIGLACIHYLEVLQPQWVFLENVEGYKRAKSFQQIVDALHRLNYWTHWEVLNAADFGVPQTRRRLILRACKGGFVPPLPAPRCWIGWYEAIADLIPTLPESEFAEWQLKRLPHDLISTHLVNSSQTIREATVRAANEPCPTVTAEWMRRPVSTPKAFLLNRSTTERGDYFRESVEPSYTICADGSGGRSRAFIADGVGNSGGTTVTVREADEPLMTLTASIYKHPHRAWLEQGRVVAMTPRALARFQSFPDTYQLPEKNQLACRVIGNAVPPLMAQQLLEAIAFCEVAA